MDKTEQMEKQLEEVQRQAGGLQECLAEARLIRTAQGRSGSAFQMGCFMDCVMEASFMAERLAGGLRRLVIENCLWKREREAYGQGIVKLHGIRVGYESRILKVELPGLLPHRKSKYTDYLYKPVILALESWCIRRQEQREEVPQFERAAVCFLHVYDRKQSVARVRDHDNIEEKQMVDALGMFFLVSDGGLYLDTFHTSLLGEEDRTCLFLMDQKEFPQWIHRLEGDRKISKNETAWEGENSTG
mgnify:CR=1 FL=1